MKILVAYYSEIGNTARVADAICEGLSNKGHEAYLVEIAVRLVIALGTVRSRFHSIYGKLNTQDRAQAVAPAKELGLLPCRLSPPRMNPQIDYPIDNNLPGLVVS